MSIRNGTYDLRTHPGLSRIGAKRELKFALESYWRGETSQAELIATGKSLRERHWQAQQQAGVTLLPVGDFAWYDQVLGTSLLVDAIPVRHRHGDTDLDTLFRVARGRAPTGPAAAAAEMTKWFNTNYHYLVPEFSRDQRFKLGWSQLFDEVEEAKALGLPVKAVLLGPVSYLWLGKEKESGFSRLELLDRLLIVYQEILAKLAAQGWSGCKSTSRRWRWTCRTSGASPISTLTSVWPACKLLLTTYFGSVAHQRDIITSLKVDGLHLDLVAAPEQLETLVPHLPAQWVISRVINGRNVWRANLAKLVPTLKALKAKLGERLWVASSCSLLHSPVDLTLEHELDAQTRSWFAFALQNATSWGCWLTISTVGSWTRSMPTASPSWIGSPTAGCTRRRCSHGSPASPTATSIATAPTRCGPMRSARIQAAAVADHHHRLLPADLGNSGAAPGLAGWSHRRSGLRGGHSGPDQGCHPAPGGNRAGRVGARRGRAQRHGGVFR